MYNCSDQGLRMSKVPSQRFDAGTYPLFVKKNLKKTKNGSGFPVTLLLKNWAEMCCREYVEFR